MRNLWLRLKHSRLFLSFSNEFFMAGNGNFLGKTLPKSLSLAARTSNFTVVQQYPECL